MSAWSLWLLTALAFHEMGCHQMNLQERLTSLDPNDRSNAILEITRQQDRSHLPALVKCLEDDDQAVRFFAILALERMTGTRLGYSYGGTPAERNAACQAWWLYLDEQPDASADVAQNTDSTPSGAPNPAQPAAQPQPR